MCFSLSSLTFCGFNQVLVEVFFVRGKCRVECISRFLSGQLNLLIPICQPVTAPWTDTSHLPGWGGEKINQHYKNFLKKRAPVGYKQNLKRGEKNESKKWVGHLAPALHANWYQPCLDPLPCISDRIWCQSLNLNFRQDF